MSDSDDDDDNVEPGRDEYRTAQGKTVISQIQGADPDIFKGGHQMACDHIFDKKKIPKRGEHLRPLASTLVFLLPLDYIHSKFK